MGKSSVLFVDDEELMIEIGRAFLERLGFDVFSFLNPVTALKKFFLKKDDFALAILDMSMPQMNGDDLALEIFKINPSLPIILCTGYGEYLESEIIRKLSRQSRFMVLSKPFSFDVLGQQIFNFLEK